MLLFLGVSTFCGSGTEVTGTTLTSGGGKRVKEEMNGGARNEVARLVDLSLSLHKWKGNATL